MAKILYLLVTLVTCQMTALANQTISDYNDVSTLLNLSKGNSLWTSLLTNCTKPTMECIEDNLYKYIQDTLNNHQDLQITSFLKLKRNDNAWSNDTYLDNEIPESRGSLDQMSKSFQNKSANFFMTHDLELKLPHTFFEGSTLKIAPRSLQDDGALVKMEIVPRQSTNLGEGRIFFKKIKKFVNQKLLYALMAILLVIKLLAAKFMFFLPMMVGAVTAKKILIKMLLFIFPALHHLFKFCAYTPHGTKLHHHKHQIAHIHHVAHKPHSHHSGGVEIIRPHSAGPPLGGDYHGKPSLHHSVDLEPWHKPSYQPDEAELDYYSGGPSFSHGLIDNRHDSIEDDNEVKTWGQGQPQRKKPIPNRPYTVSEIEAMILKAEKEAALKARLQQEKLKIQEENARLQEQLLQAMKYQEKLKQQAALTKIHHTSSQGLMSQINAMPQINAQGLMSQISAQGLMPQINAQVSQNLPAKAPQYSPQQASQYSPHQAPHVLQEPQVSQGYQQPPRAPPQALHAPQKPQEQYPTHKMQVSQQHLPAVEQKQIYSVNDKQHNKYETALEKALHEAATITFDPFYSPMLRKIDVVLESIGFLDEGCRVRLICSMYKNPLKFSPHSNLISAELSRDSKELKKPTTTNAAVVRFYRYVQAARDGQDKKECLKLYPICAVNTDLWSPTLSNQTT